MKYKQFVYTSVILITTSLTLITSNEELKEVRVLQDAQEKHNHAFKVERVLAIWNRSSENFHQNLRKEAPEEIFERSNSASSFPSEISKCIEEHQNEIIENFSQGKNIILNCFKANLMLNMLRYLEASPKSTIKLFNGLLEFKKIPENISSEFNGENCGKNCKRNFETYDMKKMEYITMYKKAMQKLINKRNRLNSYRNQTEKEKEKQLSRIDENSQAFLAEVMRNLGNEEAEKVEEEKLKKEISDPALLSVFDALTRDYMVRVRLYSGASARMMRSDNGGFTFDLEIQEPAEESEDEISSDESSTREIKDGPQAKDYFDDDDDSGGRRNNKKSKNDKKKKKEIKKKEKKLKKIIPYLLLPMLIQMTLLPFVFKKLFFLAMKALFAGKVALILIGFNLLRNTCIKNEDDYSQKIRVEHYGYRKGEEYGAWINGRSLMEPSIMTAFSEEPFRGHEPISQ